MGEKRGGRRSCQAGSRAEVGYSDVVRQSTVIYGAQRSMFVRLDAHGLRVNSVCGTIELSRFRHRPGWSTVPLLRIRSVDLVA